MEESQSEGLGAAGEDCTYGQGGASWSQYWAEDWVVEEGVLRWTWEGPGEVQVLSPAKGLLSGDMMTSSATSFVQSQLDFSRYQWVSN